MEHGFSLTVLNTRKAKLKKYETIIFCRFKPLVNLPEHHSFYHSSKHTIIGRKIRTTIKLFDKSTATKPVDFFNIDPRHLVGGKIM